MLSTTNILYIGLVLYIIGMYLSIKYDKFIMVFVSLLWIVPVYLVDNLIIATFCVIMFIIHISIPLGFNLGVNHDDFD